MKDFVFFTVYDENFKETGDGCVKSIKRWYPNADVFSFEAPRVQEKFHLRTFCYFGEIKGKELLEEYKRIIYIDADSIMCNKCDDMFGDFDMGVVQNNVPVGPEYGGTKGIYINAGLQISTNKEAWQEFINEDLKRYQVNSQEQLNTQNALNYCYHNSKFKYKLLEFPDRTYGIAQEDYYHTMYLKDNELYITGKDPRDSEWHKKMCLFHAAGTHYKTNAKINYDYITNIDAREKLKGMTL